MKNEKRYKITRKSKSIRRIKEIQKGRKKAKKKKNVQEVETLAYPRRGGNVIFRGQGEIWFSS